jgi:RNA polymerase sigma-70 factor (ECF subfamily)
MDKTLLQDKSDEELARLMQSGKTELFSLLIERYEKKIGRYARKFLADSDDINDVLQEIFIKVYVNIKSFDTTRKFSSWIYRIAHNELVNALKKREKRIFPIFNLDVFLPYNLSKDDFNKDIQTLDIKKTIDICLKKLELKYREPIILFYLDGLSYKEISEILRVPISTVGIRIKRAKEKMKNILEKQKTNYE